LLAAHPQLRATLFVTPDWRLISVLPTRRRLARLPGLRRLFYLAPRHPQGTMALTRHADFVAYLNALPRTECAPHGLHHAQRGRQLTVEFQHMKARRCARTLESALALFGASGLRWVPGFAPPRWGLTGALQVALAATGFRWVSAARDLVTPISATATTGMSGLHGVSLIHPQVLAGGLVHLPINYQATSAAERAVSILEAGGLLSIKAHAARQMLDHVMLDGLDTAYCDHLAALFTALEQRFGETIWWTSMQGVAQRVRQASAEGAS
jgi:hypothetical protein